MSENYETIQHQRDVSVGDRVRITVEGTVQSVDGYDESPTYAAMWGGVVVQTDDGSNHEIYLENVSHVDGINAVKLAPEPELAPGQLWRGGDFHFVVVGETNPVLVDVKDMDHWYRKTEFFTHFKNRNELLQEPA